TVVDLTGAANQVFYDTYDPFTPLLTAAVFYWLLINAIRIGLARLDAWLNAHLAADEKRDQMTQIHAEGLTPAALPGGQVCAAAE
ncbi:MAG TPA: hypothetical protein VNV39_14220, partial [Stellaceae bacterium]|nr:hypothetical protein [Stellaceae bacterium]